MSIRARFIASGSRSRAEAISSLRRGAEMVGLTRTAATSGSAMTSRITVSWRRHSSTCPSSEASSKIAFAYRLAAAVATRDLLYGLFDQALVLGQIQRLADHFLRRRHDQAGDLRFHGLDRLEAIGFDLLPGRFEKPTGLVLGLLLQLLAELLCRLACGIDDALGRLSSVVQLGFGFFEPGFGRDAFLLGLSQLVGNLALPRLCQPHDLRVNVAGEDCHHHQEGDLLGGDLAYEHEPEGKIDEVHRLDEADDREQPGDHPALGLRLAGDAADEGVAGQAVTDGGANGAQPEGEAEADERSSKCYSVVSHAPS